MKFELLAQFEKHTGPLATGTHKLSFEIQPEHIGLLYSHLGELEKNPYVVIHVEQANSPQDAQVILDKASKEQYIIRNKKIHALFDKIAEMEKVKPEEVKQAIKNKLKKEGKIKSSLSELSLTLQAEVLSRLERILNGSESTRS
jgi:antitoxin component of MazEF toxin-antitoxin module